jgi:hypothetical protein
MAVYWEAKMQVAIVRLVRVYLPPSGQVGALMRMHIHTPPHKWRIRDHAYDDLQYIPTCR